MEKEKLSRRKVSPSASVSKLDIELELMCTICSELFVHATTLGCSHSFCRYCIRKWTANRKECPICRATIKLECGSIVLDSLVDKMAGSSQAEKKKRQQLVKARDELEAKEANRQNDDDFCNLRSDLQARSSIWRLRMADSDIVMVPYFDTPVEMDEILLSNFFDVSVSEDENNGSMEDNDGEDDENEFSLGIINESDEDENEGESENNYEGEHDEEAENDYDGERDDEADNDYEGEHDDEGDNEEGSDHDEEDHYDEEEVSAPESDDYDDSDSSWYPDDDDNYSDDD